MSEFPLSGAGGCLARRATGPAAAVLACLLAAGCAPARVELAPLNFRDIDPPVPRTAALDVAECYWWQDDGGQAWIALRRQRPAWFGPLGHFTFQMSLVVEGLPAGEARNYLMSERALRAVVRLGPLESRFVGTQGILALYRDERDGLRGSFRLLVQRESRRMLGGWGGPATFLMQGEFRAVHDARRGREIAAGTEPPGWERDPPAAPVIPPAP